MDKKDQHRSNQPRAGSSTDLKTGRKYSSGKRRRKLRDQVKYPALTPHLNLKSRFEEINDIDYVDKLNEEDKKWLNGFMEGWVNARPSKELFKKKKHRSEVYRRNYARNKDAFTLAKATGNLVYFSSLSKTEDSQQNLDKLIFDIENKNRD